MVRSGGSSAFGIISRIVANMTRFEGLAVRPWRKPADFVTRGDAAGEEPLREPMIVRDEVNTEQRILDAAIEIATKSGIKSLTQPKVAKAAGVTQSHLTYYFPRKADLLAAVLEASHQHGQATPPKSLDEAFAFLEALIFDAHRMRFFLAAVIEAGDEDELRRVLARHASTLADQIAPFFGKSRDDPTVSSFIDRLRGLGIRFLLEPEQRGRRGKDLRKIAKECGLL
jgi:AcrR family transcriptional regulator